MSQNQNGKKAYHYIMFCLLTFVMGAVAGLIIWGILQFINQGTAFVWEIIPEKMGLEHSLPYSLAVCLIGGLLIGLMRSKYGPMPDDTHQVMAQVKSNGGYPYDRLNIITIAVLLPLIFGGSLGPEAGLTGIIAGMCTLIGDNLKYKGDKLAALAETGFATSMALVFGSPFFGVINNLEPDDNTEHYREKLVSKKARIIIYCFGVAGGMLTMKAMGALTGLTGGLPRFGAKHAMGMEQWKWFVPLVLMGILFALVYIGLNESTRRLSAKLESHPIIMCLIPAVFLALIGYFYPMAMFSGEHQLKELMGNWETTEYTLLIATAAAKLVLTTLCINFGWRGGSIFPIIFSGSALGYAFALITGMDGAFAVAILVAAMYGFITKKPIATVAILLLCFPITYILPMAAAALLVAAVSRGITSMSKNSTE